jgi:hypothetical protein
MIVSVGHPAPLIATAKFVIFAQGKILSFKVIILAQSKIFSFNHSSTYCIIMIIV